MAHSLVLRPGTDGISGLPRAWIILASESIAAAVSAIFTMPTLVVRMVRKYAMLRIDA